MTATPNFATDAAVGAAEAAVPAANAGPFVLNLCSSTTPMALAQTDLAELKRFNFFVSRRFEEGRERFRLHMGYFATLAEAEEWLNVVREIYPGAWAGEAPGKKLRERAAAAQAAQAQHAAGPQAGVSPPRALRAPVAAPPPPPPAPAAAAAEPEIPPGMSPLDAALSLRVPVLKAAPPAVAAPQARAPKAPPAAKPAPPAVAPPPSRKPAPAVAVAAAAAAAPRKPLAAPAPKASAPAAPKSQPPAPPAAPRASAPANAPAVAAKPPAAPVPRSEAAAKTEVAAAGEKPRGVFGDSNVREVLKALGDASATGETRLMRAPPPPAPVKEAAAAPAKNSLSDTQVLKLLETRRPEGAEAQGADPAHGAIPLLKPDDTGTREALKEAVTQDAPVLFAVQLQWSVQPVELDKVPPLAIFSAYTLYTVEGSRDSRKWFGLRLGFFSDAISAKQVAHYVRSEFASVAVVPVSAQEKVRATDQDKQAATLHAPIAAPEQRIDEFKLIDDDTAQTEVAKLASRGPAAAAAAAAAAPAVPKPLTDGKGRALPGRPIPKVAVGRAVTQPPPAAPAAPAPAAAAAAARGRARTAGRVGAGEKRGAQSLEETLEILGASQLSIDKGSGETLNESGVRHLRVEVQKNSPFSKLLERLSERMKKP
jgi:hypothetical protein